jgi:hypothetical protein
MEVPRKADWRARSIYILAAGQGLQEPASINVSHESVQIQCCFKR